MDCPTDSHTGTNQIAEAFGIDPATLLPVEVMMNTWTDPSQEPPKIEPDPDALHDMRRQRRLDNEDAAKVQVRQLITMAKTAMREARELISTLEREDAIEFKLQLDELRHE